MYLSYPMYLYIYILLPIVSRDSGCVPLELILPYVVPSRKDPTRPMSKGTSANNSNRVEKTCCPVYHGG